ncbi:serine/threonine-protein kinase 11-interacting protein-like [Pollicipes pollicipes]|uniref:serine/threonine-protein kinase 11-interacting protein-like n=1 Tax=Pollicipes pollicipes TaxID=41117 RepID=UPI001884D1F8|nr:serine/threonine-protein kinase 11-interacting protein-like [Pollicipes pollicipes]
MAADDRELIARTAAALRDTCDRLLNGDAARRPYLRALSCAGGLASLAELLAGCGGDGSSPFLWEELTEVRLTRCRFEALDESVRLVPHVCLLDLSQNRLVATDGLEYLAGLQHLNLAHNQLSGLPQLCMPAYLALRWLSLSSNKLESLDGLQEMVVLEHLDVSFNFLLSHALLGPLLELGRLRTLHLRGNPLCCYSDHRLRTARALHPLCQTDQFWLDGWRLERSELPPRQRAPATRPALPSAGPSPGPVRTALSSAARPGSLDTRPPPIGSGGSTPGSRRRRTKRRSRVNLADISDLGSTRPAAVLTTSGSLSDQTSSLDGRELPSHLATREQIEGLRQQLGA